MPHTNLVRCLNALIASCKDCEHAFRGCAARSSRDDLRRTLPAWADDCSRAAGDLQAVVLRHFHGIPPDMGSATAAWGRAWRTARGVVRGYEDLALLQACERNEALVLRRFGDLLGRDLRPQVVRDVVQRQHDRTLRHHAQLQALCQGERIGASGSTGQLSHCDLV